MEFQTVLLDRKTGQLIVGLSSEDSPYELFPVHTQTEVEVAPNRFINFFCQNICQVQQPETYTKQSEHQPLLIPNSAIRIEFVCVGYCL